MVTLPLGRQLHLSAAARPAVCRLSPTRIANVSADYGSPDHIRSILTPKLAKHAQYEWGQGGLRQCSIPPSKFVRRKITKIDQIICLEHNSTSLMSNLKTESKNIHFRRRNGSSMKIGGGWEVGGGAPEHLRRKPDVCRVSASSQPPYG